MSTARVPRTGRRTLATLGSLAALAAIGVVVAGDEPSSPDAPPPGLVLWETATAVETPASAAVVTRGRRVYEDRCVTCHGFNGDGKGPAALFLATPPRDFTRGLYKFRTTAQDGMPADLDLFRSITTGFPVHGMPSFQYLPEADRWALVHYLKSLYPNWSKFGAPEVMEIGPEPPEDTASIERGKLLYETKFNCAQCHGPLGHGDGPKAAELRDAWDRPTPPRDFTLGVSLRKAGWRRVDTVRMLMTGVPGTPMPSYVDQLADPGDLGEFWDVARYVEHLTDLARQEK